MINLNINYHHVRNRILFLLVRFFFSISHLNSNFRFIFSERSTFQYDFPSSQAPPVTSKPPTGFKQTEVSPKVNDDSNLEALKTRLMEKKQQQWQQENCKFTKYSFLISTLYYSS